MSQELFNVAVFLLVGAPAYLLFLRSLRQLSRQKSQAVDRLPDDASQR